MEADVQVLRAGRTIELVEATLRHDDRPALRVRAWLMRPNDTQAIAGTPIAAIAAPESMPAWDPAASAAQRAHGEGVAGAHQEFAHAHLRAPR
ncbi:thioesterase family protein [Stenotrophomonas geniculata]|uniref:thioesterase family protein n=1 Tax=Stenotrophomonas geniculata TaxID=86188 RepID=UPI002ACE5635|nr:thioesterase family protein [Stenotrophomonas geniculata]